MIALVTGASSGVGKAIATALAADGASLVLLGRNVAALRAVDKRARVIKADLALDEMPPAAEIGDVDVLVHSAGAFAMGTDDFDGQYRVNVRAPMTLTQALLPSLKQRHGQVVFINSSVGLRSRAGVAAYAASKQALKAVADSLRDEVNADGVRVLSVFLGRTATPLQARIHEWEGKPYRPERLLQPEDVAAVVLNALKLPRTAEVSEISIRSMLKP